jgi:hypothetical protein
MSEVNFLLKIGQRNERKKWIHISDNISNLFFLVALNEFDLLCYEDDSTNRLEESLNTFENLCTHENFIQNFS